MLRRTLAESKSKPGTKLQKTNRNTARGVHLRQMGCRALVLARVSHVKVAPGIYETSREIASEEMGGGSFHGPPCAQRLGVRVRSTAL
jgi:hypothetical protein